MSEILGHLHFWPSFFFMNVIFMPMFIQGLAGVSRRMVDGGITYNHGQGLEGMAKMSTMGAYGLALAQIPFILNFVGSYFAGKKASDNPWDATTLEWATPSPPPHGNFTKPVACYRGPYEYSVPGSDKDFTPQFEPDPTEA